MLSYQDTYYSNANKQFYWETSEIHGTVDFICGNGDVFFNKCILVCESRKKDEKNGEATITAPYTDASNTFGYVFDGCTIENKASKFNFGRAWGGVPRLAFLNTTLNQPSEIAATRFTASGMNVVADKFVEYNSVNAEGTVVSPATNIVKFVKDSKSNEMETIITSEQAASYSLDKVFTDWTPAALASQVEISSPSIADGKLSWKAVEGASAYAIVADDKVKAIVDANNTSYVVDNPEAEYAVRAANEMGGFGTPAVASPGAGINSLNADSNTSAEIHTLAGVRVSKASKGVYIICNKKIVK